MSNATPSAASGAAPDHITSTAPARIYLDLGDCAHLINADETFADFAGEVTWSEDNATSCGIPYVRADLVPDLAASGAAPADTFRGDNAQLISCINAALSLDLDGCLMQPLSSFGRELLSAASVRLAALASREASPAALTDEREQLRAEQAANVMPQIGPLLDAWDGLDNDTAYLIRVQAPDLKRALETISRAMDGAALASPQVAPADPGIQHMADQAGDIDRERLSLWLTALGIAGPSGDENMLASIGRWVNEVLRCEPFAAPVQVAPAGWKLVPIKPTDDMLYEIQENAHILPPRGRRVWKMLLDSAPAAPMQPGVAADDARDAAEPLNESERDELARLRALVHSPHTDDWMSAVNLEAAHQQERWGADHDTGKTPQDWFWLLGYLAGKSVAAFAKGDREKGLHHIVSSSAALLNWHRNVTGENTGMRPGISTPAAKPAEPTQGEQSHD